MTPSPHRSTGTEGPGRRTGRAGGTPPGTGPDRRSSGTPETRLDPRYSSSGAEATEWTRALRILTEAELFWLSTVRPDGRPHVTPLLTVLDRGALHFTTGPAERKSRNLAAGTQVVLTTGNNTWAEGFDVVVEGEAVRVREEDRLRELAAAWERKYGPVWHFEVDGDVFVGDGGPAHVYAVEPVTVFGFGKGEPFSQTRWRFGQ